MEYMLEKYKLVLDLIRQRSKSYSIKDEGVSDIFC